jgi:hypothetical protein
MSRSNKGNIFAQASLCEMAWDLVIKIMKSFEEGRLKDQKLTKKQSIAKPEFRQQYLNQFRACLKISK